jgi:hypothetical protein
MTRRVVRIVGARRRSTKVRVRVGRMRISTVYWIPRTKWRIRPTISVMMGRGVVRKTMMEVRMRSSVKWIGSPA